MECIFVPGTWPGGVVTRGTTGDSIEIVFHVDLEEWRLRAPRQMLVGIGAFIEDFPDDMVAVVLSADSAERLNGLLSAIAPPALAATAA